MPDVERLVSSDFVKDFSPSGTKISGRVIDGSSNPLVGRTVHLFLDESMTRLQTTTTDSNGQYSFTVNTDSHTVLAVVVVGGTGERSQIHSKLIAG